MQVGRVEHQATQFGVIRTETYSFNPGTYVVTVRHRDSKLSTPDYDYTALVAWDATEDFDISTSDPQQLLGSWFTSFSDRTIGKVATLTIVDLMKEKCDYNTCKECRADSECRWKVKSKSCVENCRTGRVKGVRPRQARPKPESCPCEKCKTWAEKERMELEWINDLPLCPCQATVNSVSSGGRGRTRFWLSASGDWSTDFSCNPNKDCGAYHPGAYGCLRSPANTGDAGQQCCFDRTGGHIATGLGAGTPDKQEGTLLNVLPHHFDDVWTFEDCCVDCEIPSVCDEYVGRPASPGDPGVIGVRQDPRGCAP